MCKEPIVSSSRGFQNATKLGPLAFDEVGRNIYVGDVAAGAIYQYSMATKVSKVLISNLSTPTALSFYSESSRLYIADPGRWAIFTGGYALTQAHHDRIPFPSAKITLRHGADF